MRELSIPLAAGVPAGTIITFCRCQLGKGKLLVLKGSDPHLGLSLHVLTPVTTTTHMQTPNRHAPQVNAALQARSSGLLDSKLLYEQAHTQVAIINANRKRERGVEESDEEGDRIEDGQEGTAGPSSAGGSGSGAGGSSKRSGAAVEGAEGGEGEGAEGGEDQGADGANGGGEGEGGQPGEEAGGADTQYDYGNHGGYGGAGDDYDDYN